MLVGLTMWIQSFNSKLVRLEVSRRLVGVSQFKEFQFQIGAIRGLRIILLQILLKRFNSKLVRLEAFVTSRRRLADHVSIPNWCD